MTKHQLLVLARHLRNAERSYFERMHVFASGDPIRKEIAEALEEAGEIRSFVERQKGSDEK